MKLEIIWSNFAENELDKIFEYHIEKVSLSIAKKLVSKIISDTNILKTKPNLGSVEEKLQNRKIKYRSLISSNYKIIYSFDEENNFIKIADIFDTRQNPKKINRKK